MTDLSVSKVGSMTILTSPPVPSPPVPEPPELVPPTAVPPVPPMPGLPEPPELAPPALVSLWESGSPEQAEASAKVAMAATEARLENLKLMTLIQNEAGCPRSIEAAPHRLNRISQHQTVRQLQNQRAKPLPQEELCSRDTPTLLPLTDGAPFI